MYVEYDASSKHNTSRMSCIFCYIFYYVEYDVPMHCISTLLVIYCVYFVTVVATLNSMYPYTA